MSPAHTAVAFSGSLRAGSSNLGLVHLAARIAASRGIEVEITSDVGVLPYYNPDLEPDLPDVAVRWRAAVDRADALIVGLPEYNYGPSAVAKNAIDWLTRPLGTHALRGKAIVLLTSGGRGGGTRVQAALAEILGLLGNTVVAEPTVTLVQGATRIDAAGHTDDAEIVDLVTRKIDNLVAVLTTRGAPAAG